MVADVLLLIAVLATPLKIRVLLVFLVFLDMVIWIIFYRLTMRWLDYLYFDKGCKIEFERMAVAGFGWWVPGIILLIDQIRTKSKSFRDYLRIRKGIRKE